MQRSSWEIWDAPQFLLEVNAAEPNVAAIIEELPAEYLDTTALLREECAARSAGEQRDIGDLPRLPQRRDSPWTEQDAREPGARG